MPRTIIAFLISPLWVFLLAVVRAAFLTKVPDLLNMSQTDWIVDHGVIGLAVGYGAAVFLGLPAYFVLRRSRRSTMISHGVAGLVCGFVVWLLVFVALFLRKSEPAFVAREMADTLLHRPYVPASFCLIGALVAVTFWAIARPDRTRGGVGAAFE